MANARDQQIASLRRGEERLGSLDDETIKRLAVMYDQARREILGALVDWYQRHGAPTDPAQLRLMAGQVARIREIERVINRLSRDVADYLKNQLPEAWDLGLDGAESEVARMAKELKVNIRRERLFAGIDDQLAIMVESTIGQIPQMVEPLAGQLTFELQYSLTQGDSFDQIVQRLVGAELGPSGASFFRRGRNSMELFARRAVIDSNNSSRQLVYERAARDVPGLMKQAIAVIQPGVTTETCLRVHGQIQPLDKPYRLTGRPRFADAMMFPSFHWNCRSSSAAYHPAFEEGARITTADMRAEARKVLEAQYG